MTIFGIGIDIIEISRIKTIFDKNGERLARKILSPNEFLQYKNNNNQINFLAKRFSVKEAGLKAFGYGIRYGLSFSQFELIHNGFGKPSIQFFSKAKEIYQSFGITSTFVSITDEKKYVCSIVIFEK